MSFSFCTKALNESRPKTGIAASPFINTLRTISSKGIESKKAAFLTGTLAWFETFRSQKHKKHKLWIWSEKRNLGETYGLKPKLEQCCHWIFQWNESLYRLLSPKYDLRWAAAPRDYIFFHQPRTTFRCRKHNESPWTAWANKQAMESLTAVSESLFSNPVLKPVKKDCTTTYL